MIDSSYANSMMPTVLRMVSGKTVSFNQPEVSNTRFLTSNGKGFDSEYSPNNNQSNIAVVDIKGAITKNDQECGPRGTVSINQELKRLANDSRVKAIVLDIDTPGGQASFLSTLSATIKEITETKPVLASYSGMCASAGYYIGSSCKEIYASENNDVVGSIGTMISFMDMSGALEKAGIQVHEIYADQSTNKNKDIKDALKGDYKKLKQELLNPFAQDFIDHVQANRSITDENVFTGEVYLSEKAIENGLIDGVMTFENVVSRALELAETEGSTSSAPTQNTKTNTNMNKSIMAVAALLGYEALESKDGHISLSEKDFQVIGNALIANAEDSADINFNVAENEDFKGLNSKVEGLSSTMTEIKSMLEEQGLKTGAKATTTQATTTELEEGKTEKNPWDDSNAEHNKEADALAKQAAEFDAE